MDISLPDFLKYSPLCQYQAALGCENLYPSPFNVSRTAKVLPVIQIQEPISSITIPGMQMIRSNRWRISSETCCSYSFLPSEKDSLLLISFLDSRSY